MVLACLGVSWLFWFVFVCFGDFMSIGKVFISHHLTLGTPMYSLTHVGSPSNK